MGTEDRTPDADGVRDDEATAVPDPRDRRRGERRSGVDRRSESADAPQGERREGDRREGDRRTSPPVPDLYRGSKRSVNEYPLSEAELEFINAINAYKSRHNRPFPTWSEVLHVLAALGYRKSGGGSG